MKIKLLKNEKDEKAKMPLRATDGAAGYDLHAFIDESVTINPGCLAVIPTGVVIEIPDKDTAGFIFGRSGLGIKSGIMPSNAVGVIDSDYRGEIKVGLCNVSDKPYTINKNDRIAQLVFMPVLGPVFEESEELSVTFRSEKGFGDSGR